MGKLVNKDILLYQDKVEKILGTNDFVINEMVISTVMDENGYKNRMPEEYLPIMSSKIYADYLNGKLNRIINEKKRAYAFILSIENKNRVFSCFATRENFIPIDLEGNLSACHKFNKGSVCGGETLYLGNIKNMKLGKKPKQKTKALLDRRKRLCSDCLVRQLCQGGCACQTLECEEYNCMSHFYHYAAVFAMAVSIMTGRVVKEIVKT
jgi:radical SAM protein with 4Fe4S-binding SPASM domain